MFGHLPELFIILVIGLIVFGPEKLPEVAANAGRMVREARQVLDEALHPEDTEVADDFSAYYYESLARSGEEIPSDEEEEPLFVGDEEYSPAQVETEAGPDATEHQAVSAEVPPVAEGAADTIVTSDSERTEDTEEASRRPG